MKNLMLIIIIIFTFAAPALLAKYAASKNFGINSEPKEALQADLAPLEASEKHSIYE